MLWIVSCSKLWVVSVAVRVEGVEEVGAAHTVWGRWLLCVERGCADVGKRVGCMLEGDFYRQVCAKEFYG